MSLSWNRARKGPIQGFHGFRIGPLPHSCPALTRGCQETCIPCLLLFSISTTWLAVPAPGLSGSAHQLPLGQCSWENPSHSPGNGHGNSRDKAALPGPSTSLIQIPGGWAGKPKQAMSLVGSWLSYQQAGPWVTTSPPWRP